MMAIGLCITLLTLFSLVHGSVFHNECHLMTVSDLNQDSPPDAQLEIPEGCGSGDLDWHYPKGHLMLSVSRPATTLYTFCLEESWATMISGVSDLTNGKHHTLSLPTKDNPTCVKSVNGDVMLMLTSEDTQYYMTTLKYSIKS